MTVMTLSRRLAGARMLGVSILMLLVFLMGSRSAEADVFACSVEGLDAAIAASELGDAGPHALDCEADQLIEMENTRRFRYDLTLDFRGGIVECPHFAGRSDCSTYFSLNHPVVCARTPDCPDEVIFGPLPTVVIENLVARRARITQLPSSIFVVLSGSSLTLRGVSLSPYGDRPVAIESVGPAIPDDIGRRGEIRISDSEIEGSVISGPGYLRIERSRISVMTNGLYYGGVLVAPTATADILHSTVSEIWNQGGLVRVRNSTVKGHPGFDGDLPFSYFPYVILRCNTEARYIGSGDLVISNSIFHGCTRPLDEYDPEELKMQLPDDCKDLVDLIPPPTYTSEGGNVVMGYGPCGTAHPTDQVGVSSEDLDLGPIQDNGGPTNTYALLENSVARDAGVDCESPAFDQRGVARPDGDPEGDGVCDSGAVEFVDCDGSGVDDGTEIAQGLLADRDGDLVPNVCQPVPVEIDVEPKSDRNRVRWTRNAWISVGVLGSAVLDVTEIDASTLAFGPADLAPSNSYRIRYKDLDHDGFIDLLARFRVSKSGLAADSTEACLKGAFFDGSPFADCDGIQIVRPHRAKGTSRNSARD